MTIVTVFDKYKTTLIEQLSPSATGCRGIGG